AAELLEELVAQHPHYVEAKLKLKQLYIDGGLEDKAAAQCLDLARIYEEQGDNALANDLLSEAYELNPSLGSIPAQVGSARIESHRPEAPRPELSRPELSRIEPPRNDSSRPLVANVPTNGPAAQT